MATTESSGRSGSRPGAGRKKVLDGQQSTSVVLDAPSLARLDDYATILGDFDFSDLSDEDLFERHPNYASYIPNFL